MRKIDIVFLAVLLLISGNLIILDLNLAAKPIENRERTVEVPRQIITPEPEKPQSCPLACLDEIKTATSSIIIPTPEIVVKREQISVPVNTVREIIVTFGSGAGSSVHYSDLSDMVSYIDTSNYKKIKSATFEAALSIPTNNGIVKAQLYNVNDNHPVWNSELISSGESPKLIESGNITLDAGKKLYRVQLLSSMGYPASINNARVKIVLE